MIDLNASPQSKQKIDIERANNDDACDYFIAISKGQSSNWDREVYNGNFTIPFNTYSNNGYSDILKDIPEITSPEETIIGSFSDKGKTKDKADYYVSLRTLSGNEPPGIYQDNLILKIYKGTYNGSYTLENSTSVTYQYLVNSTASLSLVNLGAPHDPNAGPRNVNFGTLTSGKIHNFDMTVMSNNDYDVYFSSLNDGRIKHLSTNSFVDYTLIMNGGPINLQGSSTTPVLAVSGIAPTPPGGNRYNGQITIGIIGNQIAGIHNDVVTVTLSTNLCENQGFHFFMTCFIEVNLVGEKILFGESFGKIKKEASMF